MKLKNKIMIATGVIASLIATSYVASNLKINRNAQNYKAVWCGINSGLLGFAPVDGNFPVSPVMKYLPFNGDSIRSSKEVILNAHLKETGEDASNNPFAVMLLKPLLEVSARTLDSSINAVCEDNNFSMLNFWFDQ